MSQHFPAHRRSLRVSGDSVFGFLDEKLPTSGAFSDSSVEDEEEEDSATPEEKKAFWDEQEKLLQVALFRTSPIEARIREATKEGLRKMEDGRVCMCSRGRGVSCRDCLRREMFNHLCNAGFNCSILNSKWKSCPKIPSGEHTYLQVTEKPNPEKGEVKVVIELYLKAEFEMGRASQEYNRLIQWLPEVYVGKPERLKNVIKILCGAAKKCMKERKMHLGPWRKHKYMQAKWFGPCTQSIMDTNPSPSSLVAAEYSSPQARPRPRASMLTLSLLDQLPETSCQVVAVV